MDITFMHTKLVCSSNIVYALTANCVKVNGMHSQLQFTNGLPYTHIYMQAAIYIVHADAEYDHIHSN